MTGTKCSTGRADFPRVGSPLVNWPCLTHSSPTSYAAKDVLHTRTISIGSHNCHFLRIFKLVLNFLQVRLRPCPLAIGHSMGNGLLTHLTSVLRLLSFTKSSNLWPETCALSVGVLALIPALPSGSEVRVKEGASSSLSPSTSVHCETASHPCVTLIWYLYLLAIQQGRAFCLLRGADGPVLFSVPAALVMRLKYRILAPTQPRVEPVTEQLCSIANDIII